MSATGCRSSLSGIHIRRQRWTYVWEYFPGLIGVRERDETGLAISLGWRSGWVLRFRQEQLCACEVVTSQSLHPYVALAGCVTDEEEARRAA